MRLFICLFTLFLFGCEAQRDTIVCDNATQSNAKVVAYRVAKHSRLWIEDVNSKKIFEISSVGGRREPTVGLGGIVPIQYCQSRLNFDKYSYVKYPLNTTTRFVYLPGYKHLY